MKMMQKRNLGAPWLLLALLLVVALMVPATTALAQSGTLTVTATPNVVAPDGAFTARIVLSGASQNIFGINATLTYNASEIELVGATPVQTGTGTSGWTLLANTNVAGTVQVGLITANAPVTSGEIVTIAFKAKTGGAGLENLNLTANSIGEGEATMVDGSVFINTKPVATPQPAVSTPEDTPVDITLAATDADGSTVSIFNIVTLPASGTLNPPSGTSAIRTYTPNPNFVGSDSFTFTATDPNGTTSLPATVSITVGPTEDPPVLGAIPDKVVDELVLLSFTATATDPDVPSTLTFSLVNSPGPVAPPSGASIHPDTGAFSWTPTEAQGPDVYPITVRVTDNTGRIDEETFNVTVNEVNVAPVADPQSVSTTEGVAVNIALTGSDADGPIPNTLTFSLVGTPVGGTVTGSPPNVTYTPDANFVGAGSFQFKINDGTVDSNTATVTVNVSDKVTFDLPEHLGKKWGESLVYDLTIADLEGSLTALNLTVAYPDAQLDFVSAVPSGLTSGWSAPTVTAGTGTVQVQMSGAAATGPTGTVVRLTFLTKAPGSATAEDLTITGSSTVSGLDTDETFTTGSVRVLRKFNLTGSVAYWTASRPVSDVALAITNEGDDAGTTIVDGTFTAPAYEGGARIVTPSKTGGEGAYITAYDASLVLRHSVGLGHPVSGDPLTGDALLVAEVTGNDALTANDAAEILAKSVEAPIGTFPDNGDLWRFAPASHALTIVDAVVGIPPFKALLMGDVSGNWGLASPPDPDVLAAAAEIDPHSLPVRVTVARKDANTAILTVSLLPAPEGTLGINLDLALSRAAEVQDFAPVQDVMIASHASSARVLHIGLAGTDALVTGDVATFEVALPAGQSLEVTPTALYINEKTYLARTYSTWLSSVWMFE